MLELIAMGARTPVGHTAGTSAAAVRARVARICEYPFVTQRGEPMVVAIDATIPPAIAGPERMRTLALGALAEVEHRLAAATNPYRGAVDLRLALPEARPGLSETQAAALAEALAGHLRASGRTVRCEVSGRGHAGVALALEHAVRDAGASSELLTLVLGVDSYLHADTLVWLEQQRMFGPDARSRLIPGEGAGCLALASTALRKRLGLRPLARLGGVATALERRLPGCETGSLGEAMAAAMTRALGQYVLPRDAVDLTYIDINGERYRSEEWGLAVMRVPAALRTLDYEAPADCWGDVGAATGALTAVLAVQAWARGYARGPRALLVNGSPHGLRGVVVLEAPEEPVESPKSPQRGATR